MIVAVHLADVGLPAAARALRDAAGPVPGLRWSRRGMCLDIGRVPPRPRPGRVALLSAWDADADLDAFLAAHPGDPVHAGYHVRMRPVRASGHWPALPELDGLREPGDPDEPVAVLTLGRIRRTQVGRFLRATAAAERQLLAQPDLLASTGVARPPFLSTFSLWRTTAGMQSYAHAGGHAAAVGAHRDEPFHHESVFVRLRPYRSSGTWAGVDPLAGVAATDPS